MDDCTTTKFLLACGHEPLSVRNPLDCICLFCKQLRPQGNWGKVEEILAKYEKNRPEFQENVLSKTQSIGSLGMTRIINNKIPEIAGINNPEAKLEIAQDRLIEYMYSIDLEFTRTKKNSSVYLSGYSLQRRHDFLEFTRYLAKLYPEYDGHKFYGGERRNSRDANNINYGMVKVKTKENGYPDMTDLSRAFIWAHGWEFTPPNELNLPSYGYQKKKHDNIPFNREVYFVCKSYEKNNRLRAIERFTERPDHPEMVERKDILLMAYLFISAYSRNEDLEFRESLYRMANTKTSNPFDASMRSIISQLDDFENIWDEYDKIPRYVDCINQFLHLFSFEPFYPPFLLDRFILFALVGEEIGTTYLTDNGLPENLTDGWLEEGYANQLTSTVS